MGATIGIDLGTTNTAFAIADGDSVRLIPNTDGENLTPSVLSLRSNGLERLIGRAAKRQQQLYPANTVHSVKRFIGRSYADLSTEQLSCGYNVFSSVTGDCLIRVDAQEYRPQDVSALILRQMKQEAEEYLGEAITQAVITVPAYFDDRMRNATQEAGMLAGLDVLRIINEPTAAALAYAGKLSGATGKRKRVAVYDFGGGTFDISILEVEHDLAHVLSTRGDNALGGDDIDHILTEFVCQQIESENSINLRTDVVALQRIRDEVERAKCDLSSVQITSITLPFIYNSPETGPINFQHRLTRESYDEMIEGIVQRTIEQCRLALVDSGLTDESIDEVILVGGSSRIPLVHTMLKDVFTNRQNRTMNPDEVVAIGAAMQASLLANTSSKSVVLLDVTPFSLGIEVAGGEYRSIIHRNTTIPVDVRRQLTTVIDNQRTIKVHILQGEEGMASDNTSLGEFELTDIMPAPKGTPKIELRIALDNDGIVQVSATDTRSGIRNELRIENQYRLSTEQIQQKKRQLEVTTAESAADAVSLIETELSNLQAFLLDNASLLPAQLRNTALDAHQRISDLVYKTDKLEVLNQLMQKLVSLRTELDRHIR